MVSQYSFEKQFSRELGETLLNCGALSIGELTNHYSPRFGNKTTFKDVYGTSRLQETNEYHPYAFIGIPGLSPGQGYEMLRSN